MHTDWNEFFCRSAGLKPQQSDRLRRLLRAFYSQFDGLLVLNNEHKDWLESPAMGMDTSKLRLTAHWVDASFHQISHRRRLPDSRPTLLYAGRISREKGVLDLPAVLDRIRTQLPDIRLIIAGEGPALKKLRKKMPDAEYTGWIPGEQMAELYLQADLLLLPSRFDTFGCVVLEALATGLPVVAYASKGPADIIRHHQEGFLCDTAEQMADQAAHYLQLPTIQQKILQNAAIARYADYRPKPILDQLMHNLGLPTETDSHHEEPLYDTQATRAR